MASVNGLICKIVERVRVLADQKIDHLRLSFPEPTDTGSELIRLCKTEKLSRGQIIEAILLEEFLQEFDTDIDIDE